MKILFTTSDMPREEEFLALAPVISAERTGEREITLKLKEDVNPLLRLLSGYEIERLSIEDATLEEIFLQYYE